MKIVHSNEMFNLFFFNCVEVINQRFFSVITIDYCEQIYKPGGPRSAGLGGGPCSPLSPF